MKKTVIISIVTIVLLAAGYFIIKPRLANKKTEFTYTPIKKGNIETIVSSTGALEAINTVEVGTQISGTISKRYVDYNDKVRAGQLLAVMDLKLETSMLLREAHKLLPDQEDDFKITTQIELQEITGNITGILTVLLGVSLVIL